MTLPDERTRAVLATQKFLLDLLDKKATPRVPEEIRKRARRLLKHYPWPVHLSQSIEKLPEIWGEP